MRRLWRYGEAVVPLLGVVAAIFLSVHLDIGILAGIVLVVGLPVVALATVDVVTRSPRGGSNGVCDECGAEVRRYRVYCSDCEPGHEDGSI